MPVIAAHEFTEDELHAHPLREKIYNGFDTTGDHEIDEKLTEIYGAEAADTNYNFELGLQAPALEMMLRGFLVDRHAHQQVLAQTETKLEAAKKVLHYLSRAVQGKGVNYNSGPALRELFYDRMKLPKISRMVEGEITYPMDRKVLEQLANHYWAEPLVEAALLCRDLSGNKKVLTTEIDRDWRWRCSYNIGGTTTFRWSSSKSSIGTGNNFQNITEELRRIFIPDPGWKLYGPDLEQADAREVGYFCGTILGDWSYLDACESGDLHTTVTKLCYPEWKWSNDPAENRALADRKFYRHFSFRDASKRMGHGTNFFGKPPRIHEETKIPLKHVREFQPRYFAAYPCIQQMHQWIATEIQTKGYLVNVWGQRRDFLGRRADDETLRQAIAFMFQSATGTRLNLGLWRLWKRMGTRVQILSQLHDAVYFQARETENEQELLREVNDCLSIPLEHKGRKFVVPVEMLGGWNWAHRWRINDLGEPEDWNRRGLDKIKVTVH